MANMLSPDEVLPMYSPQIICVSREDLNGDEFPALEVLEKSAISNDQIYLAFNSVAIYMYIGRYTDPWYLNEIFKTDNFQQINRTISEDEIFANAADSAYLTALTSIIEQIRYQRQPFMDIIYLFEGEIQSE
jgi:hypothetical protein